MSRCAGKTTPHDLLRNEKWLLASPALVQVIRGTAYILVVNVGSSEVLRYSHTIIGTLEKASVVSLPAGIIEVQSAVATVASQNISSTVQDQIEAMDLSQPPGEQGQVRSLQDYTSVFSLLMMGIWVVLT